MPLLDQLSIQRVHIANPGHVPVLTDLDVEVEAEGSDVLFSDAHPVLCGRVGEPRLDLILEGSPKREKRLTAIPMLPSAGGRERGAPAAPAGSFSENVPY